jgi:hypothetical protein
LKDFVIRVLHGVLSRLFPRDDGEPSENRPPPPGGLGGNDRLVVKPSLIAGAGLGCFADRHYRQGEVVCAYTGTVLTTLQMLRTTNWVYMMGLGKDAGGRRIWVDGRVYLGMKARFINHHVDPRKWNLRQQHRPAEKTCVLTANRDIEEGEELYLDYGARHWRCFDRLPDGARQAGACP